jgi:hypothetical protein
MDQAMNIEKGIPIPDRANRHRNKYPVGNMEVGDSFRHETKNINCLGALVSYLNRRNKPMRFYGCRHNDHFRIWRVK